MGHAIDPVGTGSIPLALLLPEPAPQHQPGKPQHTAQRQQEKAQNPEWKLQQILQIHGKILFPHAPLGRAHHQQPVLPHPAANRVVVQVPAGERGHIGERIFLRHVLGFVKRPDHFALFVQQHGPAALFQKIFSGKGVGCSIKNQRIGYGLDGGVPFRTPFRNIPGEGKTAQHHNHKNQKGRYRYQHGPLHPAAQLHCISSRLSR